MRRNHNIESRRDRLALANDAGIGRVSFVSVLAGVMAAYGLFVIALAVTAAVLEALGVDADYTANDWRSMGTTAGIVAAGVLFVAYLFGGYVAGRMARRAGALNGFLVSVLGLALAVVAGVAVDAMADTAEIERNLRELGIPTSGDEWAEIGTLVGLASLAAMLVGGVLGGTLGERWHGKLLRRAVDPDVGATAPRHAAAGVGGEGTAVMDVRDSDRTAIDDTTAMDRGTADRSTADHSITDRGTADHSITDRDIADRGTADRGTW